jgi:hypothetical protein
MHDTPNEYVGSSGSFEWMSTLPVNAPAAAVSHRIWRDALPLLETFCRMMLRPRSSNPVGRTTLVRSRVADPTVDTVKVAAGRVAF